MADTEEQLDNLDNMEGGEGEVGDNGDISEIDANHAGAGMDDPVRFLQQKKIKYAFTKNCLILCSDTILYSTQIRNLKLSKLE